MGVLCVGLCRRGGGVYVYGKKFNERVMDLGEDRKQGLEGFQEGRGFLVLVLGRVLKERVFVMKRNGVLCVNIYLFVGFQEDGAFVGSFR